MSHPLIIAMKERFQKTATGTATRVEVGERESESLTRALLPLMGAASAESIELALPHRVSDFRVEGRATEDAHGYFLVSHPYGGSVIDGYVETYCAVLASGVVVSYPLPGPSDGPPEPDGTIAKLWGGDASAVAAAVRALAPGSTS